MILTEGIIHIEDLENKKFIQWVDNIINPDETLLQSVKVDGVQNISFSIIEDKIYQCIISKNQIELKKDYTEWGKTYIYNNIRSQHKFMSEIYNKNKQIFEKYFPKEKYYSFECEIVPPLNGNILYYGNKYGMLIIIRPLGGIVILDNKEYETEKLNEQTFDIFIDELLSKNSVFTFKIKQYELEEINEKSVNLFSVVKEESWTLSKIEQVNNYPEFQNKEVFNQIKQELNSFKDFINQKNKDIPEYTNDEACNLKLNSIPISKRDQYKTQRSNIIEEMFNRKTKIKELLLKSINKNLEDKLYNKNDIEGVVFRDSTNKDEMVKLVDRNYFSELNKFFWSPIQNITKYDKENDQPAIKTMFRQQINDLILGNQNKTLKSELPELTYKSITSYLYNKYNDKNQEVKDILSKILEKQQESLNKIIQIEKKFKEDYLGKKLNITVEKYEEKKEVSFSPVLYNRTVESLLNEKKYYLYYIDIINGKQNNLIKLVTIIVFLYLKDANENKIINLISEESGDTDNGNT